MTATQRRKGNIVDRLIDRRHVEEMTGLSRSTIYKMISEDRFPRPIRIGRRAVRWKASVVALWIEKLPEALRSSFYLAVLLISKEESNEIGRYTSPLACQH